MEKKFTTDPRCDEACKRVLAEKIFLARIMKGCVEEYRDCPIDDIINKYIEGEPEIGETPAHRDSEKIIGSDTEDASLRENTIRYDLRFNATAPGEDGLISLIINIEAQRRFDPGYPLVKRGLYYCCRLISAQYGTEFEHSHYEKIKKVYSIWLCLNSLADWRNTITEFRVSQNNLVGTASEKHENFDLLRTIIVCPDDKSEPGSVLRLLRVLFSDRMRYCEKEEILESEFNIDLRGDVREEVLQMCNISYGIAEENYNEGWQGGMNKGMREGKREGRLAGRREGRREGVDQARLEGLKNLMKTLRIDFDRAADLLLISDTDREKYRKLITD